MAIGKQLKNFEIADYQGGCNYAEDPLSLAPNESPNAMNVVFDGTSIYCRDGYTELFDTALDGQIYTMAMYSTSFFNRYIMMHAGTKVYQMDGYDGTPTELQTSVPNTKSHFTLVKQLLIHTFDDYSVPYYWDGSSATMALLSADAPGFKYIVEHQGYLLGANISGNTLRVYYEDINTIVDGTYASYFTLTGGREEEVTSWFTLNGRLYAGTNKRIFRISYIGGVSGV